MGVGLGDWRSGNLHIWILGTLMVGGGIWWTTDQTGPVAPLPQSRDQVLNELRDAVTKTYGFLNGGPRINQGPCVAFALIFEEEWNRRFADKVHLAVVMDPERTKAFHTLIRLPGGHAFDGGNGVMPPGMLNAHLMNDILVEMPQPDRPWLEKYFGKLDRQYPRCPEYDEHKTRKLISEHLDRIAKPLPLKSTAIESHWADGRYPNSAS